MGDLLFILLLFLGAWIFWMHRRAGEVASGNARKLCKQFNLQFVSLALDRRRFAHSRRGWALESHYRMEFSPDGLRKFEGVIVLNGMRLANFDIPPYPESE